MWKYVTEVKITRAHYIKSYHRHGYCSPNSKVVYENKKKRKFHNHREKITNYFIPQNNKINHIMNKTISLLYSLLILIIQVGAARKDAQTTPIIVAPEAKTTTTSSSSLSSSTTTTTGKPNNGKNHLGNPQLILMI